MKDFKTKLKIRINYHLKMGSVCYLELGGFFDENKGFFGQGQRIARQILTVMMITAFLMTLLSADLLAQATVQCEPGERWVKSIIYPTINTFSGVAWGSDKYVAVGDSGTIVTSPDGQSWAVRNSGTSEALSGRSKPACAIRKRPPCSNYLLEPLPADSLQPYRRVLRRSLSPINK